jgi:hypothetical protein
MLKTDSVLGSLAMWRARAPNPTTFPKVNVPNPVGSEMVLPTTKQVDLSTQVITLKFVHPRMESCCHVLPAFVDRSS